MTEQISKLKALEDISALYDKRSPFTPEEKLQAALAMLVCGTPTKAAKYIANPAINAALIRNWKARAPWWPQAMEIAKKDKQADLDIMFTALMHKATKEIRDRIEHGDEVVTANGVKQRRKVSMRDLVTAMGYLFDKRALLRGDPTSRIEKSDTDKVLDKLEARLKGYTKEKGKLLEGEVVHADE